MQVDQASALRDWVAQQGQAASEAPDRRSADAARVVAVTSGKGGVGKSNLAVSLAAELARRGVRTALLDADLGLANADLLCNVSATANLAHVVAGRCDLSRAMIPAPGGFVLIPGASGLSQMAALSEFERARLVSLLDQIERDFDLLLVDTGAGIGPGVLSFLMAADEVLVVTTPEPTSITDAYAVMKVVRRRGGSMPIGLWVNHARDEREAQTVHERISAVCRRFLGFEPQAAGFMPTDPAIPRAVQAQRPFILEAPKSPSSLCVRGLAHKLEQASRGRASRGGFLGRVAAWLAG